MTTHPSSPVSATHALGTLDYYVGFEAPDTTSAGRIIYADGSAGSNFRPGTDLELSHWIPTTTPKQWAADTSTEICFRFIESCPNHDYELAVNNHIDVDGILSLFVLLYPDVAASHKEVVVGAAEHGDFQASASRSSVVLAQELTQFVSRAYIDGQKLQDLYAEAFDVTIGLLERTQSESVAATEAWERIVSGHLRLDSGEVTTESISPHVVSFVLPELSSELLATALNVPEFSALIDDSVWLWPHARNRDYAQCVQLVSVPESGGWYHDVWLPGYSWAHTPDRWRVPGLTPSGGSNAWEVDNPELQKSIRALQESEARPGSWTSARSLTPFSTLSGRGFPVVASFIDDNANPATSSLGPMEVASALERAFELPAPR